jgi:hypothetical protein
MATDGTSRPTRALTSAHPDKPAYRDAAQETADRAILGGAPLDHTLADEVAAVTSTPQEAAIDARMGLRGAPGRQPEPEDFAEVLTPEGNSGDIVGADITDSPFVYGEDGSTRIP